MGVTENGANARQPDGHAGRAWKQTGHSWWAKKDGWGACRGNLTPNPHGRSSMHWKVLLRRPQGCPLSHSWWLGAGAVQVKSRGPHGPACQSPGGSGWMLDRGLFPKNFTDFAGKGTFLTGWSTHFLVQGKSKSWGARCQRRCLSAKLQDPRDYFWILL